MQNEKRAIWLGSLGMLIAASGPFTRLLPAAIGPFGSLWMFWLLILAGLGLAWWSGFFAMLSWIKARRAESSPAQSTEISRFDRKMYPSLGVALIGIAISVGSLWLSSSLAWISVATGYVMLLAGALGGTLARSHELEMLRRHFTERF